MKNWFALIALFFSTSVAAEERPPLDYIKQIKQIEVILDDGAIDACWTNLKESREYTEEKIRMAGGNLYETGERYWPDYYVLLLAVRSKRYLDGTCFGTIVADLKTGTNINGAYHDASARSMMTYFTGASNANALVINLVQGFFIGLE